MHAGMALIRSTGRRVCVMRRHLLRRRSRDLMDGGVHRDMRRDGRRSPRGRVRRGSSEQALGVGVRVRYGSGAGVSRGRRHAADLHNATRGTCSSHRSGGGVRTAGDHCNAEHRGGSGHDHLGGYLHHGFTFLSNAPVPVRCNHSHSAL